MCEQCWNPAIGRRHALGLLAAGVALPFAGRRPRPDRTSATEAVPVGSDGLTIIRRDVWAQDRRPTGPLFPETVQFLLVHHTAGPGQYDEDFVPGHLRDIYDFHTGPQKGWPDVCYNFFVDRFGRVWEGRAGSLDGPVVADATGGSQGFAQLVCLLGDFTSVMPTVEAIDSLQRTLAWLADRHGIDTAPGASTTFVSRGSNRWPAGESITTPTIAGHRDMSSTACPGDTFYPYVRDQLSAAVHGRRGAPAPATVAPAPVTTQPQAPAPAATTPPSPAGDGSTSGDATSSSVSSAPSVSQSSSTVGDPSSASSSASSVAVDTPTSVSSGPDAAVSALDPPAPTGTMSPTGTLAGSTEAGEVRSAPWGLIGLGFGGGAVAAAAFAVLHGRSAAATRSMSPDPPIDDGAP